MAACRADGSPEAERWKAVTNRIRQTVERIRAVHAALGLHLGNAVHTGTRCLHAGPAHAVVGGKGL